MSAVLVDTCGREHRLERAVVAEPGSYGALFARAATYRAQCLTPPGTEDVSRRREASSGESHPKSFASAALVTYIPLTTSLQDPATTSEAASLDLVLQNIRLRRQVDHPFLRALIDAFYTDQVLSPPTLASDGADSVNVKTWPGASLPSTPPPRENHAKEADSAQDTEGPTRPDGPTASALTPSSTIAALVVVEEYVEGCSLADYADAVAKRHIKRSNRKMQEDAAAISRQLAELLLHVHAVGHVLCPDIPLDCVHLDLKKGCVRVRLPLRAAATLDIVEKSTGAALAVTTTVPCMASIDNSMRSVPGEGGPCVCAPEMCEMACWNDGTSAPWGALPFSADVWALGLLMLQLCSLNHKDLSTATNAAERLVVVRSHLHELVSLLPSETEKDMVELIRSCLEYSPTRRPTLGMLLESRCFAKHRPLRVREPTPAIMTLAEAVMTVKNNEASPSSMQPAARHSRTMNTTDTNLPGVVADDTLVFLSHQVLAWTTPRSFRDAFVPMVDSSLGTADPCALLGSRASKDPTAAATTQPRQSSPPSLAAATQQALQDIALLHEQYHRICVMSSDPSTLATPCVQQSTYKALRDRVQRTRQLPRDITSTTTIMEELTEHFAKLEHSNPKLCFRFMELLLEGFTNSPSDVEALIETVTLAEALLHASSMDTSAAGGAQPIREDAPLNDTTGNSAANEKGSVFNVNETLRVMPSMPAHVISSDRAANTSAILYNSWLRKQRKKHLKMDGY
ncbi:hypothetical protein Q4I30_007504 [Leishmania utingensis]|uniref:Protein kinase domain-containing protein n=1 Tax=Leishmania utingensis TaxID=653362 RepID=A0AAW2ZWH3_9TRYP